MPPGELLDSGDASGHGVTGSGQEQCCGGGFLEVLARSSVWGGRGRGVDVERTCMTPSQ